MTTDKKEKQENPRWDIADCCDTLEEAQGVIRRHEQRMADLLEWCYELRGCWQWKKDEPRAGNKAEYDRLCADIEGAAALLAGRRGVPE